MEGSPKYTLSKSDLIKVSRGALYALGGALVAYASEVLMQIDFGEWTPIVVAVSGVLINAATKFLKDTPSS